MTSRRRRTRRRRIHITSLSADVSHTGGILSDHSLFLLMGQCCLMYSSSFRDGCDSRWHPRLCCTFPLTVPTVSADPSSSRQLSRTGARVHSNGFLDDETIGQHLSDALAGVGIGDFGNFIGIEPDLALANAGHGGRKALLRA